MDKKVMAQTSKDSAGEDLTLLRSLVQQDKNNSNGQGKTLQVQYHAPKASEINQPQVNISNAQLISKNVQSRSQQVALPMINKLQTNPGNQQQKVFIQCVRPNVPIKPQTQPIKTISIIPETAGAATTVQNVTLLTNNTNVSLPNNIITCGTGTSTILPGPSQQSIRPAPGMVFMRPIDNKIRLNNASMVRPIRQAIGNQQIQPRIATAPAQIIYVSPNGVHEKVNNLSSITPPTQLINKPIPAPNVMPGTTLHYKTPGSNFRNRSGNIKRPMNAFMVWARTNRAKLSVDMPDASNAEISVRLGQVWASLSRDEKQKYYLEAERIKMRHRIDFPGWVYKPQQSQKRQQPHSLLWKRYGSNANPVVCSVTDKKPSTDASENQQSSSGQQNNIRNEANVSTPSLESTSKQNISSPKVTIQAVPNASSNDTETTPEVKTLQQTTTFQELTTTDSQSSEFEVMKSIQTAAHGTSLIREILQANSSESISECSQGMQSTQESSTRTASSTNQQSEPIDLRQITQNTTADETTNALQPSVPSKHELSDNEQCAVSVPRRGRPPSVSHRDDDYKLEIKKEPDWKQTTAECDDNKEDRVIKTPRKRAKKSTLKRKDKDSTTQPTTSKTDTKQKVSPLSKKKRKRKADAMEEEEPSQESHDHGNVNVDKNAGTSKSKKDEILTPEELWPFPFPPAETDQDAHADILFEEAARGQSSRFRADLVDPYDPLYYDGSYDSSDKNSGTSLQVDVNSWQQYLNNAKVRNSDSNGQLATCFQGEQEVKPVIDVPKCPSDFDICPTPLASTLRRTDDNTSSMCSSNTPILIRSDSESSLHEQHENNNCVKLGSAISDAYQILDGPIDLSTNGSQVLDGERTCYTSDVQYYPFSRNQCSSDSRMPENSRSGNVDFRDAEYHNFHINSQKSLSVCGVTDRDSDPRPLKKRTERIMKDYLQTSNHRDSADGKTTSTLTTLT